MEPRGPIAFPRDCARIFLKTASKVKRILMNGKEMSHWQSASPLYNEGRKRHTRIIYRIQTHMHKLLVIKNIPPSHTRIKKNSSKI